MKRILVGLVALLSIDFSQGAANKTLEAPLAAYSVVDFEWSVQVNESVPNANVTGTVQDVVAHIDNVYPVYAAVLKDAISASSKDTTTIPIQARKPTEHYCNNFKDANFGAIMDGIKYLDGIAANHLPVMGPGPGACGRVSCSYNSAIWFCNDNKGPGNFTLSSFTDIANGAQWVANACVIWLDPGSDWATVNGQQFFSDGWNVIVTEGIC